LNRLNNYSRQLNTAILIPNKKTRNNRKITKATKSLFVDVKNLDTSAKANVAQTGSDRLIDADTGG
jgi:hypothetical protein